MHTRTSTERRFPWRLTILPLGLALALLVSQGSAAPTAVPTVAWERLPIGPDRALHTMIYDQANQLFWVFGGIYTNGDTTFQNTLYKMDARNPQSGWTLVPISGQQPERRALHTAIYDPVRQRMIVFGGAFDFDSPRLASGIHVWYLELSNPNNPTWTRQSITGGPPDRFAHAAVHVPEYDAMVISGGVDRDGDTRNDNYALLLDENPPRWIRLTHIAMFDRAGHSLLYDAAGQQLIAYGGFTHFGDLNAIREMLALDIADGLEEADRWVRLNPSPPSRERAFMAATFDPVRRLIWVHGGLISNDRFYRDLSALDLNTAPPNWTITNAVVNGPLDRFGHAAAWDSDRQRMVVQGGSPDNNVTLRDTYAFTALAGQPTPTTTATPPPTATATPTATTTSVPPTATGTPTPTTTSAPATATYTATATPSSTATPSGTTIATATQPPGNTPTPTATATQSAGDFEIYLPVILVSVGFRPTELDAAGRKPADVYE